jgi:hypothetical protein
VIEKEEQTRASGKKLPGLHRCSQEEVHTGGESIKDGGDRDGSEALQGEEVPELGCPFLCSATYQALCLLRTAVSSP